MVERAMVELDICTKQFRYTVSAPGPRYDLVLKDPGWTVIVVVTLNKIPVLVNGVQ